METAIMVPASARTAMFWRTVACGSALVCVLSTAHANGPLVDPDHNVIVTKVGLRAWATTVLWNLAILLRACGPGVGVTMVSSGTLSLAQLTVLNRLEGSLLLLC